MPRLAAGAPVRASHPPLPRRTGDAAHRDPLRVVAENEEAVRRAERDRTGLRVGCQWPGDASRLTGRRHGRVDQDEARAVPAVGPLVPGHDETRSVPRGAGEVGEARELGDVQRIGERAVRFDQPRAERRPGDIPTPLNPPSGCASSTPAAPSPSSPSAVTRCRPSSSTRRGSSPPATSRGRRCRRRRTRRSWRRRVLALIRRFAPPSPRGRRACSLRPKIQNLRSKT